MSQSRIKLSSIQTLTFYKDELTASRRTSPLPQLICVGKPCDLYTPDVVRCQNVGGTGTEIDWKCEADLPSKLRLGRTEVSCEGWQGPGDPYVLKGSCSLSYRLVYVPEDLHDSEDSWTPRQVKNLDLTKVLFNLLWFGVLAYIIWGFIRSCLRPTPSTQRTPTNDQPGTGPHGSSWFPGSHSDDPSSPPPYTKYPSSSTSNEGWRPGFWTGAALGGLGAHLANNRNRQREREPRRWDWEQPHRVPTFSQRRSYDDRGEGSSNLGEMRTSTGLGGSAVR